MKKKLISIMALCAAALLSCCGSIKTASLGGGSSPGKDYVTSLRPSAAARQYFAQIGNKSPIETLTRANSGRSKSGVRFVANDGILIPAGVTIQFYNKGYCMDPKLPAPVSNEEYQLVPTSALIPSQLQGIYQNLVKRAAAGDASVKSNMQGLVWALRTAGTKGSYAARLSSTQKRILDSCSSRPGEFERVHNSGLATSRLVGELWKLADSAVNVRFGNRTWKPSDFSSAGALNNAINSQLSNLISQGTKLPIQRTGFNYGELEPGIYTDINGAGHLAFNAKIANSTNKDFIFYPCNYVGQVGSGSVLSAVSFAASPSYTQRQRVSMGPIAQVIVISQDGAIKTTQQETTSTSQNQPSLDGSCAMSGAIKLSKDSSNNVSYSITGFRPVIMVNDLSETTKALKAEFTQLNNADAKEIALALTLAHEYRHARDYMINHHILLPKLVDANVGNSEDKYKIALAENTKKLEINATGAEILLLNKLLVNGKGNILTGWNQFKQETKWDNIKNDYYSANQNSLIDCFYKQIYGANHDNSDYVDRAVKVVQNYGNAKITGLDMTYKDAASTFKDEQWQNFADSESISQDAAQVLFDKYGNRVIKFGPGS